MLRTTIDDCKIIDMSTNKLKNIINKGEGLTIEFKKAKKELPKNLFETVCAFLNKKGGEIILGVSNSGIVEGIDNEKAELFVKQIINLRAYSEISLGI